MSEPDDHEHTHQLMSKPDPTCPPWFNPTCPPWFTFRPEHPEWGENFTNMPDQVAIPDGAGGWDYKSRTKIKPGDPWLPIPTAELLQEHFGAISPPPSKETDPEFK